MKHVLPTEKIAHLWAHQTQDSARNGHGDNHSFRGHSIYSYWSEIGFIVKLGECVVLNSARYPNTTSKHQDLAAYSVNHYPHIFSVVVRHDRAAFCYLKPLELGRLIHANYRTRAVDALEMAQRSRADWSRDSRNVRAAEMIAKANEANTYFKLGRVTLTVESLAREVAKLSRERKKERAG